MTHATERSSYTIPDLPDFLREVPEDRERWFRWREAVLGFRVIAHREAEADEEFRNYLIETCRRDYAFAMVVFGVLVEPRNVRDFIVGEDGELTTVIRRKGWYPWVPFRFQVEVIREIQAALDTEMDETGKEDIFVEKSRDMGLTWIFCFYAAMDWLFGDDVLVGMYSHKEDLVDSESPKSMFYKVRSLVGVNSKVPTKCWSPSCPPFHQVPVRLPSWLIPAGWNPKEHDRKLNLVHPTKTNQIMGESTTGKSGIGDRTSYNILDEVAKHKEFYNMWSNQSAVTDHRFALTSPDRRVSDDAYQLGQQARQAARDPTAHGPRLISLPWWRHPLRDQVWENRQRARHANDEQGFAREYELDWDAGLGDWVYPSAKLIDPVDAPYVPGVGKVYVAIDPGIRDPTSVVFIQWIPGEEMPWRLVEALTIQTHEAKYLTPILMGFPPGHEMRSQYNLQSVQEVMDFTWELRQSGIDISWVGDPYGDHKSGSNSESYYMVLAMHSQELSEAYPDLPAVEVLVYTKYDEGARYHRKRKDELTKKLRVTLFHNAPRVRYVLKALQDAKYKPQDENQIVQNEPQEPAHDWTSHPRSACEYWAVNSAIFELVEGVELEPTIPGIETVPVRKPTPGYTMMPL